ncbi:MAG: hypothetical protein NMK33_03050 [Candidatus Cardinium sp.]|uniref:hypothetical protein n=1 Tax=Cardinium endosymbiont of Dermatophagoides farinae TaxID=2597823 RepID=UPI001183A534|nr:hypothetical protein [Cardinium endosymbiont of Dermatophagoides farinae]TSJ81445.1 hypothetical protein FPG78_05735 [Cardinium endosymbiont of Dermatophagoides farinae]UWW96424.1 MAG: hypothetical protein NMK33_03050 [Candidatus Cardinium sp.]
MCSHISKITIGRLVSAFLVSLTACIALKAAPPPSLKKILNQVKKGTYDEDLTVYRNRMKCCKELKTKKKESSVSLVCPLDQTKNLAQRLAQRKLAYEHMQCLKGYTIQLYMGSSRTAALKKQDLIGRLGHTSKLHYRQPHYTVQLGFFLDRLEAYFVYLTLVQKIRTAMIRPCMLPRKEYVATTLQPHESVPD